MKNFAIQRFSQVLRLDLAQGMKRLLVYTAGGVLVYLFYFWFAYNIGMKVAVVNDWEQYVSNICEAVVMFSVMTMYFFFLAVASITFRHEQKKAGRTAHLMLPATHLEKFLSRWVYMLVFSVVVGVLTFFVADVIHMGYLWLTGKPVIAATTYFLNNFLKDVRVDSFSYYSIMLANHAFFLLGGVLFRKFNFVLTAIVGGLLLTTALHFLTLDQPYMRFVPNAWWHTGITVLFVTLTCLFTWLAYRIYCRWQLSTRKLVNL